MHLQRRLPAAVAGTGGWMPPLRLIRRKEPRIRAAGADFQLHAPHASRAISHVRCLLPVDIHARVNIAAGEVNADEFPRIRFASYVVRRASLLARLTFWRTGQIQEITGHENVPIH
jgi:hypothetical protein